MTARRGRRLRVAAGLGRQGSEHRVGWRNGGNRNPFRAWWGGAISAAVFRVVGILAVFVRG